MPLTYEPMEIGYGFRNYTIGRVVVYTVKLRFKELSTFHYSMIMAQCDKISIETKSGGYFYLSFETTNYEEMHDLRKTLWQCGYYHSLTQLQRRFGYDKVS